MTWICIYVACGVAGFGVGYYLRMRRQRAEYVRRVRDARRNGEP